MLRTARFTFGTSRVAARQKGQVSGHPVPPTLQTMSACAPSPLAILSSFTGMASSLDEVRQTHAHMLKTGLVRSASAAGRLVSSALAVGDVDPRVALEYAHSLFARVGAPNSFVWNTMIRAHASSARPEAALFLFWRMLHSPVLPDKFTFTFVLKGCSSLLAIEEARQVHARVLKSGLGSDVFVVNTLLHLLACSGRIMDARKLFDRMPTRDVISRNALISAYVEQGLVSEARDLFDTMTERNVETWNFVLSGYVKNGLVDDAMELFVHMPVKDVVSWNIMIAGFILVGLFDDVLVLVRDMMHCDVRPDNCTLVNVLCACTQVGALALGEWVHAYANRNGIKVDGFLATALVDLYSKSGCIEKALQVFNGTLKKDISTWNSMIYGLGRHGRGENAVFLFQEMLRVGFAPNATTFISVLSACSHTGLFDAGRKIFNQMVKVYKIEPTIEHYGCLVDLLGRAGLLKEAEELINEVPFKDASMLWESLLGASTRHGNATLAEFAAKQLLDSCPRDCFSYVQLSNAYAYIGRWDDVRQVRGMMSLRSVKKEPGYSTIEVDGIVHEFFAGT